MTRLVVAGAGVAGLEAIIALRKLAGDRASITLVDPGTHFVYEPYSTTAPFHVVDKPRLPLVRFADDFDVELVEDSIDWVLPAERRLFLRSGGETGYDHLLVAVGARRYPAWPDAISFRGFKDAGAVRRLVEELHDGRVERVAFAVPPGVEWTLAIYELALGVAADVRSTGAEVSLALLTHERGPLEIFGKEASDELLHLLHDAGVALETGKRLEARPEGFDRVVALPLIEGPGIHRLRNDERGFVHVDNYGFAHGVAHVYAAGDCVSVATKQGGLAAQQGDAAARAVARTLGVDVPLEPVDPVLRGLLLTGDKRRFFRREQGAAEVSADPLWWPALKLAGPHLAPYLELHHIAPEQEGGEAGVVLADRVPVTGR